LVSVHRYHHISESNHRIMNPLSLEKLLLLGHICRVGPATRILDLACGKGELLCLFAAEFGATGVGVDIFPPYVIEARDRAEELGVERAVTFLEGDAAAPPGVTGPFDLVSCIGATWVGGGLPGTLALMQRWVAPAGCWLLVGEVFWSEEPPPAVRREYEFGPGFADLAGTLERIDDAGLELVELVVASTDDWDRHAASQWLNVSDWLAANPDDPEAAEIRRLRDHSRRSYLSDERRCLGWGVFVMRRRDAA
jgi:SAM-dependent methyltransferase